MLVLVLFGVRLMLLSTDNSRLQDDLEGRLDDLVQRSAELRRLGLQNERIVQSVVDGVIGVDADGVITFANPAASDMLGYARADLLGGRSTTSSTVTPSDGPGAVGATAASCGPP